METYLGLFTVNKIKKKKRETTPSREIISSGEGGIIFKKITRSLLLSVALLFVFQGHDSSQFIYVFKNLARGKSIIRGERRVRHNFATKFLRDDSSRINHEISRNSLRALASGINTFNTSRAANYFFLFGAGLQNTQSTSTKDKNRNSH